MEYNAKNFMAQGGDRLVIGGALEIREGASVTGLPAATVERAGVVALAENQAQSNASTVADLLSDCNALLQKLKSAGIMKADQSGSI